MVEPEVGLSSDVGSGVTAPKAPPEIRIRVSWCKGCGLCVEYCNRGVLELRDGLPLVLQADRCSRCMLCEVICPDFAITVSEASAVPPGDVPTRGRAT
jgi:2-oxoglutarate ferredoxin oxidoreductase subunit delta